MNKNVKEINISAKGIYYTFYGLLLSLNYAVEGFLLFGLYWLINHWWTTGEEMVGWIVGNLVLLLARLLLTHADEPWDDEKRDKIFSFHWHVLWRTILTVRHLLSKIPIRFVIKEEEK